jgi:hypothetical protein
MFFHSHGLKTFSVRSLCCAFGSALRLLPRWRPQSSATVGDQHAGRERTANEAESLLFRHWFETVQARQEELSEDFHRVGSADDIDAHLGSKRNELSRNAPQSDSKEEGEVAFSKLASASRSRSRYQRRRRWSVREHIRQRRLLNSGSSTSLPLLTALGMNPGSIRRADPR